MAAATIPAGQQPVVAESFGAKLRWGLADTMVIAKRSLRRVPRSPELLLGFTIQPVMFVLLFRYVFGGAINTPGVSYVDFLIPGILVQSIAFGSTVTGVGIADDLQKGLTDRFRSLPMARSAVLAGRTVADVVTNWFQVVVMILVGYLVGFRFSTSVGDVVAGFALLTLVGFAFSWLSAVIAMGVSTVEAAQQASFIWLFPLTFVSSAFVPPDSMPEPLQDVRGRHQPDLALGRLAAPPVRRDADRQPALGRADLGRRDRGGLRPARGLALPAGGDEVGPQRRASVASSAAPPKSWSSTCANSGSSGAARANRVIEERSFSASIPPRTSPGSLVSRPVSARADSRSRSPSTGCARYARASSSEEIAYRCAIGLWPNPAICGNTNHIQWLVLRPSRSSCSARS